MKDGPGMESGATSVRSLPWEEFAVFAVVALGLLLLRPATPYAAGSFNDDGVYIVLGKALAGGAGYRSIFTVHAPVELKYPPGLPLVLALFWDLVGSLSSVVALVSLANAALAGLASVMVWRFGRRSLQIRAPFLAVFALSPFFLEAMLQYYSIALSEPWLIAGWAVGLVFSTRLGERDRSDADAVLPLAAALGIATVFRSHALALVLAGGIAVAFQQRRLRPIVLFVIVAFAPEVAWTLAREHLAAVGPVSHLPDQQTYVQWATHGAAGAIATFARSASRNIHLYTEVLALYFAPWPIAGLVVAIVTGAFALVGTARTLRRQPFLSVGVAGFLALAVIWPFPQDRLFLPALPFVGLLAADGANAAWSALLPRPLAVRSAMVAALVAVVGLAGYQQLYLRRQTYATFAGHPHIPFAGPGTVLLLNTRFIIGVSGWLREHTPPSAVVLIDYPPGMYLYSGRRTVDGAPTETGLGPSVFRVPGRYLASRILESGVSVVVNGGSEAGLGRDLHAVGTRCPAALRPVEGPAVVPGLPPLPVYFVGRDRACLRTFLSNAGGATPAAGRRSKSPQRATRGRSGS